MLRGLLMLRKSWIAGIIAVACAIGIVFANDGLLERLEAYARKIDPRITQVMASIAGEYEVIMVARHDGLMAADVRPLVRLSINVIAESNGRREQGSAGGGGGRRHGHTARYVTHHPPAHCRIRPAPDPECSASGQHRTAGSV